MTNGMKDTLVEISRYHKGYPACWKPKTRGKLEALGFVVKQPGHIWAGQLLCNGEWKSSYSRDGPSRMTAPPAPAIDDGTSGGKDE